MEDRFYKLFGTKKPIIAMVHLGALPGSPLYNKEKHLKITTGNIEDDIKLVSNVDWIIEVVVENLKIKNDVYNFCLLYTSDAADE